MTCICSLSSLCLGSSEGSKHSLLHIIQHARQSPTSAPLAPSEMALPTSPGGPPSLVSPSLGTFPVATDGSALLMASCTSARAAPAPGARVQMLRHEGLDETAHTKLMQWPCLRLLICTAL